MSATDCAAAELDRYLVALFGQARRSTFVELRWRVPGGMRQRFIPAGELPRAHGLIAGLAPQTDVFVGVLPRWRRAGDRAAVVGDCRTVWVDLDIETAARALEPVEPAPAIRMMSGGPGHLHGYWSLRTAVPPREIERANRRLAWALGGDLSSADPARILRPPSTFHHARGGASVRLAGEPHAEPCRLGELVGGLPDPPTPGPRSATVPPPRTGDDPLLAISPERYVAVLTGQRVGRDRKVRCPLDHEDRTPSLHVYPDPAEGWFCFGCRRGGTIYDLAAALWLPSSSGGRLRGVEFAWVRDRLTAEFLDSPTGWTAPRA